MKHLPDQVPFSRTFNPISGALVINSFDRLTAFALSDACDAAEVTLRAALNRVFLRLAWCLQPFLSLTNLYGFQVILVTS